MNIAALVGPSGIGMAYLFANPPVIDPDTVVSLEAFGSVELMIPKILNGDIDIGILPPNVAAKLYNLNPQSIVAGAIVGNSSLAILTRDTSIHNLKDLKGKTVYSAGQGSTPEYVFRSLMTRTGLLREDITLDFSIPTTEIAAALLTGKIAYALLPEPFSTIAVHNAMKAGIPVQRAINLRDEWASVGFGSDFPMTICVIRTEYERLHPDSVNAFLRAYRHSIEWTKANPIAAGKMTENANLGLQEAIVAQSIPTCNLVFIPAAEGQKSIETLLSVFMIYAPESIGRKLPDKGFYLK